MRHQKYKIGLGNPKSATTPRARGFEARRPPGRPRAADVWPLAVQRRERGPPRGPPDRLAARLCGFWGRSKAALGPFKSRFPNLDGASRTGAPVSSRLDGRRRGRLEFISVLHLGAVEKDRQRACQEGKSPSLSWGRREGQSRNGLGPREGRRSGRLEGLARPPAGTPRGR